MGHLEEEGEMILYFLIGLLLDALGVVLCLIALTVLLGEIRKAPGS